MKQQIDRTEAKQIIALNELKTVSHERKIQILKDNYWWFGEKEAIVEAIKEGTYPVISDRLIELINETPLPILTEESELLVVDYKKFELNYSTNLYLQHQLNNINPRFEYEVIGEEEKAGLCPCCEYYSIGFGEDGLWDICPVCFWENGGDGPNKMTLEQAKLNFAQFGAMDELFLEFIDKEGKTKYRKKQ